MARSGSVWRICCGWLLLCCVLSTVEASTRVPVNMGSAASQVERSVSENIVLNALEVYVPPLEGPVISGPTKNVPVRGILGGTTFGLNTIKTGAKSLLKGGLQALLVGVAIDQLIKGVGWVMEDGVVTKPVVGASVPTNADNGEYIWYAQGIYSSASEACEGRGKQFYPGPALLFVSSTTSISDDGKTATCTPTIHRSAENADSVTSQYTVSRYGDHCPSGSALNSSSGSCAAAKSSAPVTYADIDSGLVDSFIDAQNSLFVKNLLKDVCNGSTNANACYDSMKKQALALKGPATVTADATTTTTTVANPNGTTSTVVTNNNTKYNIVYGSDSFTYSDNKNTTVTTDGKQTSATTTTTDPVDPADPATPEDPAPTPDEPTAAPCVGTNCTGPAYTKLYEPTKDTKEKFIDSFSDRITQAPIISAASGFFHITAGSGCPVWSAHPSFSVYQASFDAELVFDFHCQPWFVSMAQYAKIVMSIVCAYLAFRQAFLD